MCACIKHSLEMHMSEDARALVQSQLTSGLGTETVVVAPTISFTYSCHGCAPYIAAIAFSCLSLRLRTSQEQERKNARGR